MQHLHSELSEAQESKEWLEYELGKTMKKIQKLISYIKWSEGHTGVFNLIHSGGINGNTLCDHISLLQLMLQMRSTTKSSVQANLSIKQIEE